MFYPNVQQTIPVHVILSAIKRNGIWFILQGGVAKLFDKQQLSESLNVFELMCFMVRHAVDCMSNAGCLQTPQDRPLVDNNAITISVEIIEDSRLTIAITNPRIYIPVPPSIIVFPLYLPDSFFLNKYYEKYKSGIFFHPVGQEGWSRNQGILNMVDLVLFYRRSWSCLF